MGARFGYSRRLQGLHLWHDRSLSEQRFRGWMSNLDRFLAHHPSQDVRDLALLAPAFDPTRRADFMALYDRFDGVSTDVTAGRAEIIAADDPLVAVQDAIARDDRASLVMVDPLNREDVVMLAEAAAPGHRVRAYERSDWERLHLPGPRPAARAGTAS
jgi:hypothetical protein